MVFHIMKKTTLNISDVTMRNLKREAAKRGQTMSELVEAALRMLIEPEKKTGALPPLPEFQTGGLLVDINDRDRLYDAMERE